MDPDALTELFKKHSTFGYLEPAITRIAKGLSSALAAGGSRVGVSKDDEAASEAVNFTAPAAGAFGEGFQVRQFGGGATLGGGAAAGAGGDVVGGDGSFMDPADAAAAAKAAKKEAKANQERAVLFGRGGATAAAPAPQPEDDDEYNAPVVPTRRTSGKPLSPKEPVAAVETEGEGEGDEDGGDTDIDAAFASMGGHTGGAEHEKFDDDGLL